ncbi:hypothetical protein HanPSC8_Chr01g0004141 [Helianthus annuus]|nr:hypothetical protein HanPSC8_Chr01g0004141 [Helianthus annuus]
MGRIVKHLSKARNHCRQVGNLEINTDKAHLPDKSYTYSFVDIHQADQFSTAMG